MRRSISQRIDFFVCVHSQSLLTFQLHLQTTNLLLVVSSQNFEFLGYEFAQTLRHAGFEFEAYHVTASATLQLAFVGTDEIFGFFLEFDVAVAQQTKRALAFDIEAREEATGFVTDVTADF